MTSMRIEYKNYDLHATAWQSGSGFFSKVRLIGGKSVTGNEFEFEVPIAASGIPGRAEALEVAIDYGKAAIDGKVPGVDVSGSR